MNWDSITLTVFAGFGVALLVLAQLRELLGKITEVVQAWHELQSRVREGDEQGTPCARRDPDRQ